MDARENLLSEFDDVVDLVDVSESEIYELFETGTADIEINGRTFKLALTVKESK